MVIPLRRSLSLLFLTLALLLPLALGQAETRWLEESVVLYPGYETPVSFSSDSPSPTVYFTDTEGHAIRTLSTHTDGDQGSVLPDITGLSEGEYLLFLVGAPSALPVTLVQAYPEVLSVDAPSVFVTSWSAFVSVNVPGTLLVLRSDGTEVGRIPADSGENRLTIDGALLSPGTCYLDFLLIDRFGTLSDALELEVEVPEPAPAHRAQDLVFHTANELAGTSCTHENCLWNLQMGNLDDMDAIWKALTAPMTVIDGSERHQYKVRREPSADCTDYVGEVTCASQGVHVLEVQGDWTRIEAYSSSVEGSRVGVFAACFTGWVETAKLREQEVSQHVGVVIDKLQQRLYVFQDGELLSTLLCSTGYARSDTPFNETPAGEFYAISHTGGFWSGNLYCDMAIRINDGILLHEVPCTITEAEDGTKVRHYEKCEMYLGEKASHGCIRIQRSTGVAGVSIKWLWENLPRSGNRAKVIIWEDSDRVLGPASDDYLLYYNPNNGRQYHSDPYCPQVNAKFYPLTAFSYGELDNAPYASLTPCPGCAPELRHAGIDTANSKNLSHAYDRIRTGQ